MRHDTKMKTVSIVTDEEMFCYVWDQMVKQNFKATEGFYTDDEESLSEIYVYNDENQYISWDENDEIHGRCAIGFLMNPVIYKTDIEGSDASDSAVIQTVMNSNKAWKFTSRSRAMLVLLQNIHDACNTEDWECLFQGWRNSFNKFGDFVAADDYIDFAFIDEPLNDNVWKGSNYEWSNSISTQNNKIKQNSRRKNLREALESKMNSEESRNESRIEYTATKLNSSVAQMIADSVEIITV